MNSLEDVWNSYRVTVDSMKVAERAIDRQYSDLFNSTDFAKRTLEEVSKGRNDADDLFVLALWAVFERTLRDYLAAEGPKPLESEGNPFHSRLSGKIRHDMEYWRNEDVLDVFKSVTDNRLIGHAKQIKRYRDWVAHRNPRHTRPASVTPRNAYKTLMEIVSTLPQSPESDPPFAPGPAIEDTRK
jgi:hypothetical protein